MKNVRCKIPEIAALGLENANSCIFVESGKYLMALKKHAGWKYSIVAEGYVDELVANKNWYQSFTNVLQCIS